MKQTTFIFTFWALALTISSCSSSGENEENGKEGETAPGDIILSVSTNAIQADGKDKCNFIVTMDKEPLTKDVEIYMVGNTTTPLEGQSFTSTQTGEYKFFASYKDKVSKQVTVKVLSKIPDLPADAQPQNTSFKRRVMALQFTGTGCPNCPYMIAAIHETLKSDVADKVIFTGIHAYNSDDIMYTSTTGAIGSTYGNGYYPGIGLNLKKEVLNAVGDVTTTTSRLKNMITKEQEGDARAGISAAVIKTGNEIIVKVAVKAAETGNYKVGAWLLEDGIYAKQSDNTSIKGYDFDTHNNVVREVSGRNDFDFSGDNLGEISKGETQNYVLSMKINPEWNLQNCKIVCFVSTPNAGGSAKKFYITNAVICNIDGAKLFEYK